MKDLDTRIAETTQKITEKLLSTPVGGASETRGDADTFFGLNQKLLDLARFHRNFIKLQYGDEEFLFRALSFVEEVMLPSISGPELTGNWFHYTLQTVINIGRPMLGPTGTDAYDFLNDMESGVKRMRELSFSS